MKTLVDQEHLSVLNDPTDVPTELDVAASKMLLFSIVPDMEAERKKYFNTMKQEHQSKEGWEEALFPSVSAVLRRDPKFAKTILSSFVDRGSSFDIANRAVHSLLDMNCYYNTPYYPLDFPVEKRYTKKPSLFPKNEWSSQKRYGIFRIVEVASEIFICAGKIQELENSDEFQEMFFKIRRNSFKKQLSTDEDEDIFVFEKRRRFELYGNEKEISIRFFRSPTKSLSVIMEALPNIGLDPHRYLVATGKIKRPEPMTFIEHLEAGELDIDDLDEFKDLFEKDWPDCDVVGLLPDEYVARKRGGISLQDVINYRDKKS